MANGIELPRCDERLVQSLLVTFLRTNNGCKLIERDGRLHTMIIHKLQQGAKLRFTQDLHRQAILTETVNLTSTIWLPINA